MSRLDQSPEGSEQPKREITTFDPKADVERIVGMPATNEFDPKVNQPATRASARSYAERARERATSRMSADDLKGKKVPLGHVASPPKEKMEQIAALGMPSPMFDAPAEKKVTRPPPPQGVGSAYDVNQAMARGELDRPVSLREVKEMPKAKGLSPESVKAIQMVNEDMSKATRSKEDIEAEKAVAQSMKEGPKAEDGRELDKAEKTIVENQIEERPQTEERPLPFDFDGFGSFRNTLMDPERRKKIEGRLEDLDLADMIMKREIQQDITVVPGKFTVTLRTFSQKENLWMLQYIFDFPGSQLYTRELLSTCQLVCSVVGINGKMLPEHRANVGQSNEQVDKAAFEKKKDVISSFPVALIADISVQQIWFQDRINRLFSFEALKNG
jgi:hypothetical protein